MTKDKYSNKFKNILLSIKKLLSKEQNLGQVRVVDNLLVCLEKMAYLEFERELNSLNMWGGAGSILDVYFENNKVQKKFHYDLSRLINLMKRAEILDPNLNLSQKIWF